MKRIVARAGALVAVLLGAAITTSAQQPVRWSMAPAPKAVADPGKTFNVTVAAEIDATWHVYGLTEPPPPIALVIKVVSSTASPFSPGGVVVGPDPKRAFDPNFNMETEFHEEAAAFTLPVRIAAGTKPGRYRLRVDVLFQTCNDHLCLPPRTEELKMDIAVGGAAAAIATTDGASTSSGAGAATSGTTTGGTSTAGAGSAAAPGAGSDAAASATPRVVDMASTGVASTLSAYLSLALLMGALSLLTPCVFPMVPITVSYFTNRAGRSRRDAVTQALVYGLGIILTFTAVGFTLALAFGASGLNRFAADPWLNLGVTALFIGFALSLFGVYELALPSRFVTMAAKADAGKGRYVGTLLMGLAFTLTSFTCTAPFLGTLLVVASQGDWQWPLAGMLAFSSIFALPFVLLALAPQWLASLPKSGSWLIAVKATMGLLELAAAMKFLSNVDLVWGWGIFTRPVVLVSWILVAVALVAYLAGLARLGHAPRLKRPGFARLTAVAAGIVLGVWMASGLSGRRLGELEAFLPPADLTGIASGSEPSWVINDFEGALAEARRQNRPVLVDFTGYTCTNCRWMEANMFPKPEVARELARYVRARLYTDGQGEIYRRYQQMEQDLFGTVALPYYAVFTPEGRPVVAYGGLTRNSAEFVAFLRKGLE